MKKTKVYILMAALLGTLFASFDRLFRPKNTVCLANSLGLINDHGIETLLLDPASSYNSGNPWPNRGLLVQRGATGYQYGDLCAGVNLPLGVTLDAPFNASDPFNVRRLGARPGLEIGIASAAITIDHLVCATTLGKIADITTIANGTYWVVGRAAGTVAVGNSTMECPYVPMDPYQLTVTNGTLTYPTNPT